MTKPSPLGGPGYSAITINPYVPMQLGPDPYDPVDLETSPSEFIIDSSKIRRNDVFI